jgi:cytochrome c553
LSAGRASTVVGLFAAAMLLAACGHPKGPTSDLAWAYPRGPETRFGKPLGPGPFHMPGSALTLTRAQIDEADGPIDWHPDDHPPAPVIVRGSPRLKTTPCAECHAFNGGGFPGSADLSGLPAAYIVEQVNAFRSGERRSADPNQPDTGEMIKVARAVTPQDLEQAATYFAALPRSRWLRVVESPTAPRTVPDSFGWLDPAPGGGTEPVGDRVVELSDDLPRMFLGDDHVTLTDYAPPGALARGKAIAETGGDAGTPCGACHGPDLRGTPLAPPIAGRPAGYLARTLWDIRVGARRGPAVELMQRPAKGLTPSRIRDVAAYVASLKP